MAAVYTVQRAWNQNGSGLGTTADGSNSYCWFGGYQLSQSLVVGCSYQTLLSYYHSSITLLLKKIYYCYF